MINYNKKTKIEQQKIDDSIKKAELEQQIKTLKTSDNVQKLEPQNQKIGHGIFLKELWSYLMTIF